MKSIYLSVAIVVVLFVVAFPRNLPQELSISPQWERELIPVGRGDDQADEEDAVIPVHVGEVFGYVDGDGRLLYADTAYYGVTLSDAAFINYSSVNQNLVVRDTRGEVRHSFDSRGYPYYVNNSLYVLMTDRTGLSKIDTEGRELWTKTFSTVVTDIDSALDQTLVGLLDGRVVLVAADGTILFERKLTGSTFDGVFGCALSPDTTGIGVISGLSPQRVILLKRRGDSYDIVLDEELGTETRGHVHATFSANNDLLVVAQENHVVAAEEGTESLRFLPINGTAVHVTSPADGSINIASVDGGESWYTRFASVNTPMFSVKVNGGAPFLRVEQDDIWIGARSRLAKYSLEAK